MLFFFVPFAVFTILYVKNIKRGRILELLYPTAVLGEKDIVDLSYSVMKILSNKSIVLIKINYTETKYESFEIVGMLKNHIRFCSIYECPCKKMQFTEENSEQEIVEKGSTDKQNIDASIIRDKDFNLEQTGFEILNTTLKNLYSRDNTAEREILIAYVNFYMLNRIFNSLYNLMLAEENPISMYKQFQVFCLRQAIVLKMLDQEKRNSSVLKEDFNQMICYHQKFMSLQDLITNTTNLYIQYWEEFLKAKPGIF